MCSGVSDFNSKQEDLALSERRLLFLAGLFMVCMCGLMLQVAQTRLLSVIGWYYLAFFAISMAMFGMTAGALLVYFKAHLFSRERLMEHLAWLGAAFAVSVFMAAVLMIST